MRRHRFRIGAAVLAAALAAGQAVPAAAQQAPAPGPLANLVLAGYGGASYEAALADEFPNDFAASVSPVILYRMGSDVLFETELEFGLSGERTTTALEYAQIDYLGFEGVQIIAGKFLLPFGLFSERFHPTWINKLPSSPLVYGHAHGGVAEGALLPMLTDVGLLVRAAKPFGDWGLDLSVFVTQGPRMATEEEGEGGHVDAVVPGSGPGLGPQFDEGHDGAGASEIPPLAFGVSFEDNNKNKLLGARLGLVRGPSFEVYVSGFHAMYDPDSYLDLIGAGVAADIRRGPLEFRGEWVTLWQEFQHEDGFDTAVKPGYYAQLSRRFGALEPVARWCELLDVKVNGAVKEKGARHFAVGANYWIAATIPIKIAYEWRSENDPHVLVEWAFGF